MKKVAVIVNKNAKKVRRGSVSLERLKSIGSKNADFYFTESLENLQTALDVIKEKSYDYIGVLGGDGSLHQLISCLLQKYNPEKVPALLILKGGTMDNIAASIGLKGNCYDIIKRISLSIESDQTPAIIHRYTMRVDNQYCFIFGTGLTTNILKEAYSGREKGLLSNLKTIAKAVIHSISEPKVGSMFEKLEADVTVDGSAIPFKRITGLISGTVEQVGMGFKLLARANERDNAFHVIITGLSPLAIVAHINYMRKGRKYSHPLHFDETANDLQFKSTKSFLYTMDGDLYESNGCLRVSVGPKVPLVIV
jgi:diacylglycerol kinase family enzyme